MKRLKYFEQCQCCSSHQKHVATCSPPVGSVMMGQIEPEGISIIDFNDSCLFCHYFTQSHTHKHRQCSGHLSRKSTTHHRHVVHACRRSPLSIQSFCVAHGLFFQNQASKRKNKEIMFPAAALALVKKKT